MGEAKRCKAHREKHGITNPPLLPPEDLEAVARSIRAALESTGHAASGCAYFALLGALVLQAEHGLGASVNAGHAAHCIERLDDNSSNMMEIPEQGAPLSLEDGAFHAWTVVKNGKSIHAIDFASWMLPEVAEQNGLKYTGERRVFAVAGDGSRYKPSIKQPGDAVLMADVPLTNELMSDHDVIQTCKELYPVVKLNLDRIHKGLEPAQTFVA